MLVLGPRDSNRGSCCIRIDRNYSGSRVRHLPFSPTRDSQLMQEPWLSL